MRRFLWRVSGVSNAWLETLLSVIEVLPKETLRHEVIPLVITFFGSHKSLLRFFK